MALLTKFRGKLNAAIALPETPSAGKRLSAYDHAPARQQRADKMIAMEAIAMRGMHLNSTGI